MIDSGISERAGSWIARSDSRIATAYGTQNPAAVATPIPDATIIRRHAPNAVLKHLGISAALICITRNACFFAALFISMFAINSIGSNATRVTLRKVTSNEEYKRLFAWAMGCVEIKQIAMPVVTGMIAVAFGWRWAFIAIVSPVVRLIAR